jgi:hypothetical protein
MNQTDFRLLELVRLLFFKKEKTMQEKIETISINGVDYVRADQLANKAESFEGMKAVIVRTYSAGVFYGFLESRNGREVVLRKARRMWRWFGASLSECAQSGTPNIKECKFPEAVDRVELLEVIEILDLTAIAKKSLDSVPVWKA